MIPTQYAAICTALEDLDATDNALKCLRPVHARAWQVFRTLVGQATNPGQLVPVFGRLFNHAGDPVLCSDVLAAVSEGPILVAAATIVEPDGLLNVSTSKEHGAIG